MVSRHYREALFLWVGKFVDNPPLSHEIFRRIAKLHQRKNASSMRGPKASTQLRVSYLLSIPSKGPKTSKRDNVNN